MNFLSFWSSVGSVWNTVWPILIAIVLFGLVVLVHEFGHFLFAKLFGVRVNEFALGFGPKLLQFRKGETQYSWRLLPLGGFCAMEGEDGDSDDSRSFGRKKVWQRIIICAAGAVFNILLGFLFMMLVVSLSGQLASTTIRGFTENSVSSVATDENDALCPGDRIVSINGSPVYTSDDIFYMMARDIDGTINIGVVRDGKTIDLSRVRFALQEVEGRPIIQLDFYVEKLDKNIGTVLKEGVLRTFSMTRMVWTSLVDLVTGHYGISDISGPVGVTQYVSEAVASVPNNGVDGLIYLLKLLSMLTVNLGIMNLLPIPALDGSRIVFLLIEGIRRKPVPKKWEAYIHATGLVVLFAFIILICLKDLWFWAR